jgi:glycine betaine/choline ABC-type transport system substrate-binding protein
MNSQRKNAGLFLIGLGLLAGCARGTEPGPAGGTPVVIGSKNFTEQLVLGELIAAHLEARGIPVQRRLNLAGTFLCWNALQSGEIDLYVEYTGTALTAILKEPPERDPAAARARVADRLAKEFGVTATEPLGFRNDFAIVVRGEDARRDGLRTLTDLARTAGTMRAGFGPEFLSREDGWPGLAKTYGLTFGQAPRQMDLGLLYQALQQKQVDVVAGNSTDGLIESLGLVVLEDDKAYFPVYEAVPLVRTESLAAHPGLREALAALAGAIAADDMRRMNLAVDGEKRDPAAVAREFLGSRAPRAG